jgi:CRP-like cAMP-binding protein
MNDRNYLIQAMSHDDRAALEPFFQRVTLASGDVLYEPGYRVEWVYFPNTAVASVVTVMADGRTVESDTVGYESVVGALSVLGSSVATSRTFIQIAGTAVRAPAVRIRQRAEVSSPLRLLLIRHANANLAQAHQSVACNALHALTERLCRWLLMSHDRTADDRIRLTQQYLATMLGVQRTTVTEALQDLTMAGLIRQERGAILILDRAGLEGLVCECYDVVRYNLEQLIGRAPSADRAAATIP